MASDANPIIVVECRNCGQETAVDFLDVGTIADNHDRVEFGFICWHCGCLSHHVIEEDFLEI